MKDAPGDSGSHVGASGWHSAIEVRQLRALLAVVQHGSLSAAAQALGIAQSTVSEALTALDRAVGTPTVLRKRGARASPLTSAGEALLPYARDMLRGIDELHLAVAQVTRDAQAHLQVIANESVSTYILGPTLGALRKRWPKVGVSVTVGSCGQVRSAMATGQIDLGLLIEEASHAHALLTSARSTPSRATPEILAADVPLVVFGSPSHPLLRYPGAVRQDMLQPFSLLIADSAGDFHDLVRRYFASEGLPGPRLDSVGSIEAVKRGVEADSTVLGLLPRYAVADDLDQGRLRALRLQPVPPRMHLIALTIPREIRQHPFIDELLDGMRH